MDALLNKCTYVHCFLPRSSSLAPYSQSKQPVDYLNVKQIAFVHCCLLQPVC